MRQGAAMENTDKPFEIEKTFGLGVLLKLTKTGTKGIEIATIGNKFKSNVSLNELDQAVKKTIKAHNIKIKTE